ncbi:MAG: hypothetical protein H7Z37_17685 [Pyrinomonadaceae bacterium]|nr:hypothetical protein [Pyrinomonadaceae bacterium]
MLYKPNFCAECGEKIERVEWNLLTSRKFCENCATVHAPKSNLWKPIAAILAIFVGGFTFGQLGQTKKSPVIVATTQNAPQQNNESPKVVTQNPQTTTQNQPQSKQNFVSQNTPPNQTLKPSTTKPITQNNQPSQQQQVAAIPTEPTESTYFCGAKTKKDAPCSRRVKGGGRCWQHVGQAAMLPANKLFIQ